METIVAAIIGATVGSILTGFVTYFLTTRLFERQTLDKSASKFRSTILHALEGHYPISIHQTLFQMNSIPPIKDSLPIVWCACSEFEYFVKDKKGFQKARKILQKFFRIHDEAFSNFAFFSMPNPNEFNQNIVSLLSFSEYRQHDPFAKRFKILISTMRDKMKKYSS